MYKFLSKYSAHVLINNLYGGEYSIVYPLATSLSMIYLKLVSFKTPQSSYSTESEN